MIRKKTIKDVNIEKKNIILRIDIDSSYKDGVFLEPHKVKRYKDIFEHFTYHKAKVAVLFEMGKNRVRYPGKLPVKEIIQNLSEMLDQNLIYCEGHSEKNINYALEELLPGEILFFENMALEGDEEKEDSTLFKKLEKWADYYVNDAFGISAREYYTCKTLPTKLDSYSGMILIKEISKLADLLSGLSRPITIVMGGLDVDYFMTEQILKLSERADSILLTGSWVIYCANALDHTEPEEWMGRKSVKSFEKNFSAIEKKENIHFPQDVKVYKKYADGSMKTANIPIDFIKKGLKIGDIGQETLSSYKKILEESKSIIWLGSVGKWWKEGFADGTIALYDIITRNYCDKIIAGDDLIESLIRLGKDESRFSYAHYGDGETILKFLSDGKVVGVDNLKNPWTI